MRTKILVAVAAVGVLALGGAALASNGTGPTTPTAAGSTAATTTTPSPDDDTSSSPASQPPGDGAVSLARAKRIALARTGGGTVVDVQREEEHGRWVWSVRIVVDGQRARVDVDALTAEITRYRLDDQHGGDRDDDRDRIDDDDHDDDHDDDGDDDDDRRGRGSDDPPGDDDDDRD